MTSFQRMLLATIGATFILVVIGGTVRATDSGLGCPDWPMCHGQIIPPAEKHTLIEFSHRTAASIVGFMFLGVTYFTFKTERKRPLVFWLAFSAGVLLVVQIILGGITVKRELPAEITAAHLATAMLFMGTMILAAAVSLMGSRGEAVLRSAWSSAYTKFAVLSAAVAFVTLVLGSYISGTDASLACSGWPLCNGSLMPGGDSAEGLHWLHRLVAGLLGLSLLGLTYQAIDERRGAAAVASALAIDALYITQALVGAANIWTDLAAGVVVVHLSLAALLWCALVAISALSFYWRGEPLEAAASLDPRSRKAAGWAR